MIEVLSIVSEIFPLVKTGGLADVAGALPRALAPFGVSMRTLIPGYPSVTSRLESGRVVAELPDYFGGPARLIAGRTEGLDIIVLEAPHLFDRPGNPYLDPTGVDWSDNWQRFAALSFAGYELGRGLVEGYHPQILHSHDWQAGLVPAYVAFNAPIRPKTVITVHNLAFQGIFGWDIFPTLRLDQRAADEGAIEFYGNISFLKGGLQCADAITTVSPTYAHEISTAAYGMGLEGLLRARSEVLHGILNGIDTGDWNPGADPALPASYGASTTHLRAVNKAALAEAFGLEQGPGPLFGVVSRLTWQKGMDMLVDTADELVARGGRLVVLGSGDAELENALKGAAMRHPGKVAVITKYDERLSHLVQGGADVMVVPSRFEPCGLTQLYGLRYGCVPLVSRVGGLADTLIDANEAAVEAGVATGIVFSPATQEALAEAIRRAIALFGREKVWRKMQRRGMKSEVSWEASAEKYADLYSNLLGMKRDDDQDD
jgi:starch synthase